MKNKSKNYLRVALVALLFMFAFAGGVTEAKAAEVPEKVTGLKQISSDVSDNEACIRNLKSNSTYYVKVRGFIWKYNDETMKPEYTYGEFSDVLECFTNMTNRVKNLRKTKSTVNSLTIEWSKVKDATGYIVEYEEYDTTGEEKEIIDTLKVKSTKVKLKKLKKDRCYRVMATPYRTSSDGKYTDDGNTEEIYVKVTPTKLSGVHACCYDSNKRLFIDFDDKDKYEADGYQYEVWTAYGKSKRILKKTQNDGFFDNEARLKSKSFSSNMIYKVRVRSLVEDENSKRVYSEWSNWAYVAKEYKLTKVTSTSKGAKLTWKKIKGADRYVVYASTKEDSGLKKVKTVSGKTNTCTISQIKGKSLKKGKTYYFYVVPYNKVNGKYYKAVAYNWGDGEYSFITTKLKK